MFHAARTKVARCCYCQGAMRVSVRALSVSCPHCRRVVSLADLRIVGSHPGKMLATCGDIRVEAGARLQVPIVARNIAVFGRVRGAVTASESVEVGPTGYVVGDIAAPKIVVQDGGVIQGRCIITVPRHSGDPAEGNGAETEAAEADAHADQAPKQHHSAALNQPVSDSPPQPTTTPRPLARPKSLSNPAPHRGEH